MRKPPVIIAGPPRSGTTLLAGILNLHPDVGPKPDVLRKYTDVSAFLRDQGFAVMGPYQAQLERHDIWRSVWATMGGFRDLHRQPRVFLRCPVDRDQILTPLRQNCRPEDRLIAKQPELVWALLPVYRAILEAKQKVLVCLRDPVEIFASIWHYRMFSAPPIEGFSLCSKVGISLFRRRIEGMLDAIELAVDQGAVAIVSHWNLEEDTRLVVEACCEVVDLDPAGIPPVQPVTRPERLTRDRIGEDLASLLAEDFADLAHRVAEISFRADVLMLKKEAS